MWWDMLAANSWHSTLTMVEQHQVSSYLPIFIYHPWRLAVLHVELFLWEIYLWCVSSMLASWMSIYQKCQSIPYDRRRTFLLNATRMQTLWKEQAGSIIVSNSVMSGRESWQETQSADQGQLLRAYLSASLLGVWTPQTRMNIFASLPKNQPFSSSFIQSLIMCFFCCCLLLACLLFVFV